MALLLNMLALTASCATQGPVAGSATTDAAATTSGRSETERAGDRALEEAGRIAASFPEQVHAKVKSKLQREVVLACLELGQTEAAIRYARTIDDWRRLESLALIAQSLALGGHLEQADACLREAVAGEPQVTDWMKERLDAEIGVAFARLGRAEQARRFGAAAPTDLTGRVERELVALASAEELDRQAEAFDHAVSTGSLDIVRSGIDGHLEIWKRAGRDPVRAERAERAIREGAKHLPFDLQVETRLRVAEAMSACGAPDAAAKEMRAALTEFRESRLEPELAAPLARDLARALCSIGMRQEARELLNDMLRRYLHDAPKLVDMDRADVLRPIAEGLHQAGDDRAAMRAWTLALEAGALNPNARPRAEDLCLTWLSMARAGVAPTDDMRAALARIERGLKAPW